MFIIKRLTERGDTIVEVLIAIAVISLILGGAYVTTNKSLQTSRAAQERTNGTKLVEGQVEAIKGLSKTNPNAIYDGTSPNPFCVNLSNATTVAASNTVCKVNANGNTPLTGEPVYTLSVSRAGNQTFTVRADWPAVTGGGTENVTMTYRIPKP